LVVSRLRPIGTVWHSFLVFVVLIVGMTHLALGSVFVKNDAIQQDLGYVLGMAGLTIIAIGVASFFEVWARVADQFQDARTAVLYRVGGGVLTAGFLVFAFSFGVGGPEIPAEYVRAPRVLAFGLAVIVLVESVGRVAIRYYTQGRIVPEGGETA
jgi:hypothetical protein